MYTHTRTHTQRLEDTNPQVREAAFEAVGTLLKVVGEKPMLQYTENIDKTKMAKVQLYMFMYTCCQYRAYYNSLTSDICQVNISECQVNFADA